MRRGRRGSATPKPPAAPPPAQTFDQLCEAAFQTSEKAGRYPGRGEKGFRQYARAVELYEEALRMKPGNIATLYNCGHVLYTQSRLAPSEAQERKLLRQSIDKFEAVLRADPKHLHALYNLAIASAGLADLEAQQDPPQTAAAIELYRLACQRFEQLHQTLYSQPVIELPPDHAPAPAAPAAAVTEEAEIGDIDDPIDLPDVLAEWGETLAKHAALLPATEARSLFQAAYDRFEQLQSMPQHAPEAMVSYASALLSEAEQAGAADPAARVQRAVVVLQHVLERQPRLVEAHSVLGDAFSAQASLSSARLPSLLLATASYQRAHTAFLREALSAEVGAAVLAKWADCLLDVAKEQRKGGEPAAAEQTLQQAEEKYRKALAGSARSDPEDRAAVQYNLACALALNGRAAECAQLLSTLQREQPDILSDLVSDPDFASVAASPWFQALLQKSQQKTKQ